MDVNIDWYRNWFAWSEQKAQALAKAGELVKLAEFSRDLSAILTEEIALWTGLRASLKGNLFGIALGVGKWIAANPDPLKSMRAAMQMMRARYGP